MERILKTICKTDGPSLLGFITYEELNKSLEKENLSNENLEQAFIHILDEKIILVEKSRF